MRILILVSAIAFILGSCGSKTNQQKTKFSLDQLLLKYPDSVGLLIDKGNQLIDSLEFQRALELGAKAFRLDSNNVDARVLYAECLINKPNRSADDVMRAFTMYRILVKKQPKNVPALVGLANTLVLLNDHDNAFKFINQALRIDKTYRDAYILKGTIYKLEGNVKLAISSYETAVQQDPNYYMTYLLLGSLYEYQNDPICIEKYTTAYQLQPKNVEVIYALAYAKENFGQVKAAQTLYRKMTRVDSTFADGYFHLGALAQFNFNQPDSAMIFYKKAVKVNPQHIPSYHNMGLLYEDRNDLSNALFSYAKALKIDSTYQISRDRVNVLRKKI
ncbi:MAG: tetratricopeptide repeat protein [Flavobacteriales bacterium]